MTPKELIQYQMDDAGFQLSKVLEGLTEEQMDAKVCGSTMSPRETMAHLCDCYQAVITETAGGKHEWGSLQIADSSSDALTAFLWDMRKRAVEAVMASDDDKWLRGAYGYICAHDCYHVGQLATLRVERTPGWDPYSIYRF
jgi:hypothetical protein